MEWLAIVKPVYRVPLMAEINAIPWNGFNVVSTFSGCGGSCLGYKMAGFKILWANEFVPAAQETYKANFSGSILDTRDVRAVEPADILDALKIGAGEIDILDGSPPCASFSTAGKRELGWGTVKRYSGTKQRTDDLFYEYVRLLNGLQPKVFIAENVSGLVKGKAKGYFLAILDAMKKCGYNVRCRLLDAQWLGVPQMRQRLIFCGVRSELNIDPVFPSPLPYQYTIRDALFSEENQPTGKVEAETDISKFAIGREWAKILPGYNSEKYFNLCKPRIDSPCYTITAPGGSTSTAMCVHPLEKRRFSVGELKRICAFPDDFVLTGSYTQQCERLGRAVPPVMMRAIATTIRDKILCQL